MHTSSSLPDLIGQMSNKSDEELDGMFRESDQWSEAALEAAGSVLKSRGLSVPDVGALQQDGHASGKPTRPHAPPEDDPGVDDADFEATADQPQDQEEEERRSKSGSLLLLLLALIVLFIIVTTENHSYTSPPPYGSPPPSAPHGALYGPARTR